MPRERSLYVALLAFYALSRAALHVLGVRYGVDYGWQHFHDLDLLRDRLLESSLYSHAFPPVMNLLVGVVLKLAPAHAEAIYHALSLALGLGLSASLLYLLRVVGVAPAPALGASALFSCTPQVLYFEKLLHYELGAAALLALAAVLFHRALCRLRAAEWLGFFLVCALLAWTRLTFHLVWMLALVALALACARGSTRRVLASAALPVLLVLALYVKNQALFGFFGASSRSGFTLALMTTKQLRPAERKAWLREGRLHPASAKSVYSGADAYARFVDVAHRTGIPALDRVRKRDGHPNYNHHALIEVAGLVMRDAREVLAEHPGRYATTVLSGLTEFLSPSTRWHPKDPEGSPHRAVRVQLEPWENAWNALLHGFPAPVGVYLLLIALAAFAVLLALRSVWSARAVSAEDGLVLFLALNCAYVPAVSCLATRGELSRYRLLIEALLWTLAALGAKAALARLRGAHNEQG